jgi:peptidoglycan/xylan/chitin deacetylase (PgdA/CDA1 family)
VIPILMYHYVRVVTDRSDTIGINLSVTPELFAAQMQYLADHGYTTLTMHDVFAILAGQQPLPPRPIALTFDDGYRDFYTAAWPVLSAHHFKATSYIITGVIGQERYMTWAMLKELDAGGLVEIGAHTVNHVDLHAVGAARAWQEIDGSKVTLEQGLGHPVTAFCYPSGKYDQDVIALVRKAGFLTATTVEYGTKQNLQWAYELPRVRVNGPDPLATWIAKLP